MHVAKGRQTEQRRSYGSFSKWHKRLLRFAHRGEKSGKANQEWIFNDQKQTITSAHNHLNLELEGSKGPSMCLRDESKKTMKKPLTTP